MQKVGFRELRQSNYIVISDGILVLKNPGNNPINEGTMEAIVGPPGWGLMNSAGFCEAKETLPSLL